MMWYFYLDMIRLPNKSSVLCIVLLWQNICKCLLHYRSIEQNWKGKIGFLKINIGFLWNIFHFGIKYHLNKNPFLRTQFIRLTFVPCTRSVWRRNGITSIHSPWITVTSMIIHTLTLGTICTGCPCGYKRSMCLDKSTVTFFVCMISIFVWNMVYNVNSSIWKVL